MAKKKTTKKKTTKKKTTTKKTTPKAADRLQQKDEQAISRDAQKILSAAHAIDTGISAKECLELRVARAELVAAQSHERDAKEALQRARELRETKQDTFNEKVAVYLPLPDDEADPDQARFDFGAKLPKAIAEKRLEVVPFITRAALERLEDAGIKTVGELHERLKERPADWYAQIGGMGDRTAIKIGNQFKEWLAATAEAA